jgi:hypothetical protein
MNASVVLEESSVDGRWRRTNLYEQRDGEGGIRGDVDIVPADGNKAWALKRGSDNS